MTSAVDVAAGGSGGDGARVTIGASVQDLVLANRILSKLEILDGLGHVSIRHPLHADRFLIARNVAPDLVQEADIVDLDSETCTPAGERVSLYLERFIHSEIYRAEPTVGAIVHSHSASVLPFSVVPDAPLRPILQPCGFLSSATPVFEIRDIAGGSTDMLISNRDLGRSFAKSFSDASVVLMRGHGYTVVGDDVRQAVFRAVYTQKNAQVQLAAQQLGQPIFMTEEESIASEKISAVPVARLWDLWAREVAE